MTDMTNRSTGVNERKLEIIAKAGCTTLRLTNLRSLGIVRVDPMLDLPIRYHSSR